MERLRLKIRRCLYIDYGLVREALAELVGTTFLVALGDGSVAQSVLSRSSNGDFLSINFGWAFAVTFAVYISGGVSGGHINPAISLVMCLLGRISFLKLIVYSVAQYIGAIFGAALVFAVYFDALEAFDGGNRTVSGSTATAGIFATYPQSFLSAQGGLGDQIFGTSILSLCVMAITDPENMNVSKGLTPFLVGLCVGLIGIAYGFNCGYAINPARDLGPRIFTAFAGWGSQVFSYNDYNWFWIPIVGPYVGAVLGAFVYQLSVGLHWPKFSPKSPSSDTSLEMNLSGNDNNVTSVAVITKRKRHLTLSESCSSTFTIDTKCSENFGEKGEKLRNEKQTFVLQHASILILYTAYQFLNFFYRY